jgi:hypothetical protein
MLTINLFDMLRNILPFGVKGKKDQHKNQESNIQQYTHSKPNKQNRVYVIV